MRSMRIESISVEDKMINRDNWKLTKKYLAYLTEVKQLDAGRSGPRQAPPIL